MFVVEGYQRPKTRHPKKIQVTQIEDQWSLPLREATDCFADPLGVRGVNFATNAHDRGKAVRVHPQSRPCAIELLRCVFVGYSSHVVAPIRCGGERDERQGVLDAVHWAAV